MREQALECRLQSLQFGLAADHACADAFDAARPAAKRLGQRLGQRLVHQVADNGRIDALDLQCLGRAELEQAAQLRPGVLADAQPTHGRTLLHAGGDVDGQASHGAFIACTTTTSMKSRLTCLRARPGAVAPGGPAAPAPSAERSVASLVRRPASATSTTASPSVGRWASRATTPASRANTSGPVDDSGTAGGRDGGKGGDKDDAKHCKEDDGVHPMQALAHCGGHSRPCT